MADDRNIRIDRETHHKAKVDAAKKGKTLKQYLHDLVFGKDKPEDEKTGKGK